MSYLIALALVFAAWRIYRQVSGHLRGMGLGWHLASGGDPTREARVSRYKRGASRFHREQEAREHRKAIRARSPRRARKHHDAAFEWWHQGKMAERFAERNAEVPEKLPAKQSHGIRRKGTEKGKLRETVKRRSR